MGKISKAILQDICATLRRALDINQWRDMNNCFEWFKDNGKNDKCSFIKYNNKKFYPSITEKSVDDALDLAKEYMLISEDKHCRKSLMYYNGALGVKKGVSVNFDNPMGAYEGGIICGLVGDLLLYNLNNIIDPCNHGLYRDELIIVNNCTPRKVDVITVTAFVRVSQLHSG